MRKILALILALMLAGGLAACEPQVSGGGASKAPRADQVQQHKPEPTGAQPAPVQGDPSAHNTQPGEVGLFLTWSAQSRATPLCEWSKNGASQPCANMGRPEHEGDRYWGFWEHVEQAKAGDVYTVNAEGTGAILTTACEISWKGVIHEGTTQGKRCGITLTLN